MTRLLTFGETLGLLSTPVGVPLPSAASMALGLGGAESNVAVGVRRLGGDVTWLGRLGADSVGDLVERRLTGEGIRVVAVRDPDAPSAIMLKERPTSLRTRVTYYRRGSAGSRLTPDDLDAAFTDDVSVLHLTGITPGLSDSARATVGRSMDVADERGLAISVDVNHRHGVWAGRDAAAVYRSMAARAAVVFAGEDEARLLCGTGSTTEDDLVEDLARHTDGDVVLKLGERGCRARLGGVDLVEPAVRITPLDTVGAGDAFVAGYLAELLQGAPPVDRLRTAVRCGAVACLSLGDWEGAPTREDLSALDASEAVLR